MLPSRAPVDTAGRNVLQNFEDRMGKCLCKASTVRENTETCYLQSRFVNRIIKFYALLSPSSSLVMCVVQPGYGVI